MAEIYLIANGVAPTTAKFAGVTTSATLATMLQVKLGDNVTSIARVVEWGVSFDGSAAATPFVCELIAVDVAATITAHVAAGIQLQSPNTKAPTNNFPFAFGATNETGYTSSSEGTPTAGRLLDGPQYIAPTNQFIKQEPLGRDGSFDVSEWLRIRVWGDGARKVICYVKIEV